MPVLPSSVYRPHPLSCPSTSWIDVVPHHRPRREAQRIDASQVGQEPLADVVDVVELDPVVAADARAVAPDPADGDAGVVQVADLVVRHGVAEGVHDQHAHAAVEEAAEVVEPVVGDDRLAGAERLGIGGPVDLDPSRGDPGQLVAHEAHAAAAVAQVDRVAAEVLQHASFDRDDAAPRWRRSRPGPGSTPGCPSRRAGPGSQAVSEKVRPRRVRCSTNRPDPGSPGTRRGSRVAARRASHAIRRLPLARHVVQRAGRGVRVERPGRAPHRHS